VTARSFRDDIVGRYAFELDRFQLDAIGAFDDGQHVIVAAPTGSGKTVVAEYGIEAMVRHGSRRYVDLSQ
jgi:ATP-dependent RNA helicase HelY